MKYLLDANALIALLNKSSAPLARRLREHSPDQVAVSVIVIHELFYGAFKSRLGERNAAVIDNLQFAVLDYWKEDAREAGEIRAFLSKCGKPIGPHDVLIAGQARARGLILITHNVREFERVPNLRVEDWEI